MAEARTALAAGGRGALGWLLPAALLVVALLVLGRELQRPSSVLLFWPVWAETGALAAALTAIMLTGGIDLSLGSIMALASVVLGQLWQHHQWSIGAAAVAALGVGMLAGTGNAALVVSGIPPLIATLATLAFYAGLAMAISAGERVSGLPPSFTAWGQEPWLRLGGVGVPNQIWLLFVVFLLMYVGVHHTRFGRYLFAMGENRVASRFAGLPTRRLEATLYIVSGLVAGAVAVFYSARSGAAIPTAGQGRELEAIACVVLGGTRVTGGYGGMLRTLLGLAVLAHMDIALQLAEISLPWMSAPWQPSSESRLVLVGVLMILVAVWNERVGGSRAS
jgi:rhamnose transport system permease protein